MNLTNCKRCKKTYRLTQFSGSEIKNYCPTCVALMIEELEKLNGIIAKHTNITLKELSNKTQISENIIKKYINIGKLPFLSDFKAKRCETCSIPVKTSKYCTRCIKFDE